MQNIKFKILIEFQFLVLNLGTSAQLCCLPITDQKIASASLLTEPFFGDRGKTTIIVAASMNGGNAVNLIAEVNTFSELFFVV